MAVIPMVSVPELKVVDRSESAKFKQPTPDRAIAPAENALEFAKRLAYTAGVPMAALLPIVERVFVLEKEVAELKQALRKVR